MPKVILHDGKSKKTLMGAGFIREMEDLSELSNKPVMGYLAYPNPTLKNEIPDQVFYEFEKIEEAELPEAERGYSTSGEIETSDTKEEYLKKIHKIKQLLTDGEIYQINYAMRFRKKFKGDPYAFFRKLIEVSPTEFAAFVDCGDYQIVSASPERLFKVSEGKIRTEPIKGTMSKEGGRAALDELIHSEKERAELDMITDLERNDVGKVCKFGTLKLLEERAVMELSNLWHCYSVVEGELEENLAPFQIVEAMFPGGSITGCPKKRAMRYIEELEGLPRNIFTGSIGYIDGETMDFNITIRTALIRDGYVEYWAGGGIVYDSDPESEYAEAMLKAEKFFEAIS